MAELADDLVAALRSSHGLRVGVPVRLQVGETTRNFVAEDPDCGRVFVKVYPSDVELRGEVTAIRLSEFAAGAGVPVAELIRTRDGRYVGANGGLVYSVWRFIDAGSGLDNGLSQEQMADMGTVLGRMHARFAQHPVSLAGAGGSVPTPDLDRAEASIDALNSAVRLGDRDPFLVWAKTALAERKMVLPRVRPLVAELPSWSAQVIHGDLAGPNVLLAGDRVGAVIDFKPPALGAVAHDLSRIGCDPRTVLTLGDRWPRAMAGLAAAYWDANPVAVAEDVTGCVRWWLAYTAASTYPLRRLIAGQSSVYGALAVYARQRHAALLAVLDRVDEVEELLRDVDARRAIAL